MSRTTSGASQPSALPAFARPVIGVVAAFSAVLVAVISVLDTVNASFVGFDHWEEPSVVQYPARYLALAIDFTGEPLGSIVILTGLVVLCVLLRRRRLAVLALAGPVLTVVSTTVLKPVVGRTIHGGHLSFPSGHTAVITAVGFVLGLVVVDLRRASRQASVPVILGAATVGGVIAGWAQIALSAHYPTDVVAGYFTALAVVPPAAWLVDQVADRFRRTGERPA